MSWILSLLGLWLLFKAERYAERKYKLFLRGPNKKAVEAVQKGMNVDVDTALRIRKELDASAIPLDITVKADSGEQGKYFFFDKGNRIGFFKVNHEYMITALEYDGNNLLLLENMKH